MKLIINKLVLLIVGVVITSITHAYDPSGGGFGESAENFDSNSLNGVADQTIGESQRLLAQRGGDVECIKCHISPDHEYDGVIDTIDIVEQTMGAALSCMDWEVRGVCVWVTCVAFVCAPSVSVKVKNFVPDLVMQSYDRANGEPWTESQVINMVSLADAESSFILNLIDLVEDFDVSSVGIEGGTYTQGQNKKKAGLMFKLVDAYGNPASIAYNAMATGLFNLVCQGKTWPFFPYYVSNLDAIGWRWNLPEMFYPQSLVPMYSPWSLGPWGNNWGPIHPRHGFLHQEDPLKAAVLTTFRAAHFITRNGTPHVYVPVSPTQTDGYWPAGPLDDTDGDTGKFQQLYPYEEDDCRVFPYGLAPSSSRRANDGNYVWNFWKSYKCCQRTGNSLVYHTG